MITSDWYGCHGGSHKGVLDDDAFSHPAKFAAKLIQRIYRHGLERGYWRQGDLVADPFGGVGIGGIHAAARGLRWIGVELEQYFADLAGGCDCTGVTQDDWVRYWPTGRQKHIAYRDGRHVCPKCLNGLKYGGDGKIPFSDPHRYGGSFGLHLKVWEKMGKPIPVCVQGDSREFSKLIREAVDSIITSPPFLATEGGCNPRMGGTIDEAMMKRHAATHKRDQRYGTSDGQIGAMKEGKLDQVVDEVAAVITSPPYADTAKGERTKEPWAIEYGKDEYGDKDPGRHVDGYGQSPGQLGGMPEGDHTEVVDSIITSPPYAESLRPETEEQTRRKQERIARAKTIHNGRALEKPSPGKAALGGGYGVSKGQVGGMPEGDHGAVISGIVTSPPYVSGGHHNGVFETWGGEADKMGECAKWAEKGGGYSGNPENMGNLAEGSHEAVVDAICTSPPFEKGGRHPSLGSVNKDDWASEGKDIVGRRGLNAQYGESQGQIGLQQAETYWHSCAQVYLECYKALRSGGVMCVVVKDFIRQKKRVPLCDQTLELLEAIGFEPLERIRAWMIKSEYKDTLFDDGTERYFYEQNELKRRKAWEAGEKRTAYKPLNFEAWLLSWKQRKSVSFFRRLTELKGSPRIDSEEVLFVQKPHNVEEAA